MDFERNQTFCERNNNNWTFCYHKIINLKRIRNTKKRRYISLRTYDCLYVISHAMHSENSCSRTFLGRHKCRNVFNENGNWFCSNPIAYAYLNLFIADRTNDSTILCLFILFVTVCKRLAFDSLFFCPNVFIIIVYL